MTCFISYKEKQIEIELTPLNLNLVPKRGAPIRQNLTFFSYHTNNLNYASSFSVVSRKSCITFYNAYLFF